MFGCISMVPRRHIMSRCGVNVRRRRASSKASNEQGPVRPEPLQELQDCRARRAQPPLPAGCPAVTAKGGFVESSSSSPIADGRSMTSAGSASRPACRGSNMPFELELSFGCARWETQASSLPPSRRRCSTDHRTRRDTRPPYRRSRSHRSSCPPTHRPGSRPGRCRRSHRRTPARRDRSSRRFRKVGSLGSS